MAQRARVEPKYLPKNTRRHHQRRFMAPLLLGALHRNPSRVVIHQQEKQILSTLTMPALYCQAAPLVIHSQILITDSLLLLYA